jgi:LemA protein
VNTVKGYAQHEEDVFVQVTQARTGLVNAIQSHDAEQMANANAALSSSLSRLMVSVEAYPQLKADQLFIRLQDDLTGTENRISVARNDYNQAVNAYNAYIRQFPTVITAKVTGAKPRKYFTASANAETGPPPVDFSKPGAKKP